MKEIDLFGIYLSPFLRDAAIGAVVFAPVKLGLDWLGLDRFVWHRPLFDLSLLCCIVAGIVFTTERMA